MPDEPKFDPKALRELIDAMALQPEQAQTVPAPPGSLSPLSLAMLIGGNGLDAGSTIYALRQPGIREANPLLGSHPGTGTVLAAKVGGTAAEWLLLRLLAKKHPKLANGLAKGIGGAMAGIGVNNLRLAQKGR